MEAKLYEEILEIMGELDKKFDHNSVLQSRLNKTDSLNTYLFSSPPKELKKSNMEIDELMKKGREIAKKLSDLGYVLRGVDYKLERVDAEKMRVESAKYGFVVQYGKK